MSRKIFIAFYGCLARVEEKDGRRGNDENQNHRDYSMPYSDFASPGVRRRDGGTQRSGSGSRSRRSRRRRDGSGHRPRHRGGGGRGSGGSSPGRGDRPFRVRSGKDQRANGEE